MQFRKSLLLFGASALLLAACGDTGETTANPAEDENTTEVSSEAASVEITETEESVAEESSESAEDEVAETSREIVLGEPMEIGDYTITFQSYSLGVDYEGKDALIINYDWVNNSDEAASPYMTFMVKGFQDSVETGDVFMVEGVDLGIGQKEVKPGGKIEGAQDLIGLDDLSKPLELEIDELMSFESNPYTTVIDLSTIQ